MLGTGPVWVDAALPTARTLVHPPVPPAPATPPAPSPSPPKPPPLYAALRIVRENAGPPSVPAIGYPDGYGIAAKYQTPSRREFYAFVEGPRSDAGIPMGVRWSGEKIIAIITGDRRIELAPDPADPETMRFTLPVVRTTQVADSGTVQVWSMISTADSGLEWRVEHNDVDRAAGYWQKVPWPVAETRSVINYMVAAEACLYDSGLVQRARQRQHFFSLMGFETNNTLHQDNPPHWHLAYYPGKNNGAKKATVPHYYLDGAGRITRNAQGVQGSGEKVYKVGEAAPIYDADGGLVLTTVVRTEGGLDLLTPNGPGYAIVSPGSFAGEIQVHKDGHPWIWVSSDDDVRAGVLRTRVRDGGTMREEYELHYDPLTGKLLDRRKL
ncbi:hypothetical protein Val02_19740 [Virgisporangium aliadipatigenens]|uniref:Uncharacterized protein n=1 Tax=Virgisporangium aliadipatigenens TaxID=741659 RepID=A0A8J4DPW5_9ACTN|nr:hypothetical protein Val02_19740 [Virgisporangium aliadipatigenens]